MPAWRASAARGCGVSMLRLHGAQHREQLLVGDAEPIAQIHALRAEAFADMRVQEPVADGSRELAPVIALDQSHHHVERGDAAGAGDAIAVDLEQRRHDRDIGEGLAEGGQVLPMQRGAALIEQARPWRAYKARRRCRRWRRLSAPDA